MGWWQLWDPEGPVPLTEVVGVVSVVTARTEANTSPLPGMPPSTCQRQRKANEFGSACEGVTSAGTVLYILAAREATHMGPSPSGDIPTCCHMADGVRESGAEAGFNGACMKK